MEKFPLAGTFVKLSTTKNSLYSFGLSEDVLSALTSTLSLAPAKDQEEKERIMKDYKVPCENTELIGKVPTTPWRS